MWVEIINVSSLDAWSYEMDTSTTLVLALLDERKKNLERLKGVPNNMGVTTPPSYIDVL